MMNNRTITFLIVFVFFKCAYAQDPLFSQYQSNSLYLNPACAGIAVNPTFTAAYRDQWPSLTGNFKTALFEYNQYSNFLHGGIGGYFLYDDAGGSTLMTEVAKVTYAYHLKISDNLFIQPGIGLGYTNEHISWNKLTFGDEISQQFGFVYPTVSAPPKNNVGFFDGGAGVIICSKYIYGGFAADHLTQPDESFVESQTSRLPVKYTVNGGAIIPLSDSTTGISLSPNFVYISQQDFSVREVELTMKVKTILVGIGYRENDAVIYSIGYQNSFLRIGYSYDETTSALKGLTGGTHEFFVSYILHQDKMKANNGFFNPIAF